MKVKYVVISIAVLWLVLGIAWAVAYFVSRPLGMGILTFLVIAAWNDTMDRVIGEKYR